MLHSTSLAVSLPRTPYSTLILSFVYPLLQVMVSQWFMTLFSYMVIALSFFLLLSHLTTPSSLWNSLTTFGITSLLADGLESSSSTSLFSSPLTLTRSVTPVESRWLSCILSLISSWTWISNKLA
jgi:hypothetical protein